MIWTLALFFLSSFSFADPSWKWANAIKIVEKHEFYTNNEIIIRPKNSWQVLFAILYNDSNLKTLKDCVYYQVPGEAPGILKIKTMSAEQKCEEFLFKPGDEEWKDLRALQFSVQEKVLSLSMTNDKFQIETWTATLFNVFEHPTPKALMPSAEYRSPKIIYLTPYKGVASIRPQKAVPLEDKKICHDIAEDCIQKSASRCSECSEGWYEIPNGCAQGPKYCGRLNCGGKNSPACRRGMKFQKQEKSYHCSEDTSFAYCQKGLTVHCQANLPYCL